MLTLIARGDVRPVISGVQALDDIRLVHEQVKRGSVVGRRVVRPDGALA